MKLVKIFILLFLSLSLSSQELDKDLWMEISVGLGVARQSGIENDVSLNRFAEGSFIYKNVLVSAQASKGNELKYGLLFHGYRQHHYTAGYQFIVDNKIRFQPQMGIGKITYIGFDEDAYNFDSKVFKVKVLSNYKLINYGVNFDFIFSEHAALRVYSRFIQIRV